MVLEKCVRQGQKVDLGIRFFLNCSEAQEGRFVAGNCKMWNSNGHQRPLASKNSVNKIVMDICDLYLNKTALGDGEIRENGELGGMVKLGRMVRLGGVGEIEGMVKLGEMRTVVKFITRLARPSATFYEIILQKYIIF